MDRFPDGLIGFQRMFPDDDACAAWLVSARRPRGFTCPGRGHSRAWTLRGVAHTFEFARCHRQTSVTAGTIVHGSKLALTVCVWAACLVATHSNGISALQLQKQLGIGSYCSACLLAIKLRRAMTDPDRNSLSGFVEVNETSLPFQTRDDPQAGGPSRSHDGKLLVVGAMAAHVVLPWIHRVFSNFKGWARGVYHGLLPKFSQSNLDEFVFRFNHRTPRHAAFRSLFDIAPAPNPLHTES